MNWIEKLRRNRKQTLLQEQAPVEINTSHSLLPAAWDDDLMRKHGMAIYDRMLQDSQVRACFNLKRLGALSVPWQLQLGDTSRQEKETLQFIEFNLQRMKGGVFSLLWRVLDAMAKGFSVLEKLYSLHEEPPWEGKLVLTGFKAKDPARFAFDLDEFRNIRALILNAPDGRILRLPREKFVLYTYNHRYESPFGEPDLRAAYTHWRSKHHILKFWDIYLAKYASPTMLGIYKRGLTQTMQDDLLQALDRVQQETAIIVPEEIQVKALEFGQGGADSYAQAITYHNAEIAKSILGETLTTDEGQRVGSLALGKIHFEVLQTQLKSLRSDLAERVMMDQIIRPLVALNFGDVSAPVFVWQEADR